MSETFAPDAVAILIPVEVTGPARTYRFEFVVDTGATRTVMRPALLARLGYDLTASGRSVAMRSVTGGGTARLVTVLQLEALDLVRTNFELIAHELPAAVTVDGLLGLDFFRGHVLQIDLVRGKIDVDPEKQKPRLWWRFWR